MAVFTTEEVIALIKNQVCFDALADDNSLAERREIYPKVSGSCEHHGGKCTDLLYKVRELELALKQA
jgi:hypothetical protein